MTYIPLHHKYRPQTFTQLVGQDAIATTLSNALLQNRIAPAYLFTGARGTGKTSSARIFAKSLNCLASDAPTDQPCGVCETCRAIANGSALDVIEIDAASNTGVDNIRELIERAQFAPVQCRYKAYVIDEVHMLSNAAFNALLKTLEEPPDRVVFILATTDPQRVLPTIISRCQRFDFRRIPLGPMVKHLSAIAQKESISITKEALQLIAQISQGGLRDAESLLDQLSLLIGEITSERVWDLVGAVPERDLMTLVEAIASDNPETVLDTTRKLMDRGREPLIVLQNLASFYRDLLIAKTARDRGDLVALTPPTWQHLCDFAKNLNISTILVGQKHLKDSEVQLKNTTQPRLWLEVTLLGLLPSASSIQPTINVSPSLKAPPKAQVESTEPAIFGSLAEPNAASTPTPTSDALLSPTTSSPTTSSPTTSSPITSNGSSAAPDAAPAPAEEGVQRQDATSAQQDLAELWQRVLSNLQPLGIQALLSQQGNLLSFDGQTAQVSIKEKLFNIAQGRVANIKAAFLKTLGIEIKLSLVVANAALTEQSNAHSDMSGNDVKPLSTERSFEDVSSDSTRLDSTDAVATSLAQPDPELAIADPPPDALLPTFDAPPAYYDDWEDEAARAALNLADAFNGAVVDLDNPSLELPSLSIEEQVSSLDEAALDELEDNEDEDQDVDF
ncbi:MAG: DNA polymerase III subunit gamma/tau [Myxacorys californica WJT36-NPBG1]|nr:DNA polymerase III subunit gamma/tau [Myxacorys californica WJT36-NPBG1]